MGNFKWIFILTLGWEPEENEKEEFIQVLLNTYFPMILKEGVSFLPKEDFNSNVIKELPNIIDSPNIVTTWRIDNLSEKQALDYINSELINIYGINSYSVEAHKYDYEGIQGYIIIGSPKGGRRMVQQIRRIGDKKEDKKRRKGLSPLKKKSKSLYVSSSDETGVNIPTFVPDFDSEKSKESLKKQEIKKNENDWESFLEGLDSELKGEKNLKKDSDISIKKEIQQKSEPQNKFRSINSSSFDEWSEFLEGIEKEIGTSHPQPKYSQEKQKPTIKKNFTTKEKEKEEKGPNTKIFHGRGLIISPEEIELSKKVKENLKEKEKTPLPSSTPPTPKQSLIPTSYKKKSITPNIPKFMSPSKEEKEKITPLISSKKRKGRTPLPNISTKQRHYKTPTPVFNQSSKPIIISSKKETKSKKKKSKLPILIISLLFFIVLSSVGYFIIYKKEQFKEVINKIQHFLSPSSEDIEKRYNVLLEKINKKDKDNLELLKEVFELLKSKSLPSEYYKNLINIQKEIIKRIEKRVKKDIENLINKHYYKEALLEIKKYIDSTYVSDKEVYELLKDNINLKAQEYLIDTKDKAVSIIEKKEDIKEAIKYFYNANIHQIPQYKDRIIDEEDKLINTFIKNLIEKRKYKKAIFSIFNLLLKEKEKIKKLNLEDRIISLILHYKIYYTYNHKYKKAYKSLKSLNKIKKINKIKTYLNIFLKEIKLENKLWKQIWRGIEKLKRLKKLLHIKFKKQGKTIKTKGRILRYKKPNIEILSNPRFKGNINLLNYKLIELFIKYGRTKSNINIKEMYYKKGIYFFSQKKFKISKNYFIKADKLDVFEKNYYFYNLLK